jgi:hypothetical protein
LGEYRHDGSPTWLAAYPNDGTYDWFGLRFYRQALRFLLVRGAAANSFTTAKTLIYYGAVAHSFRTLHNLSEGETLSELQLVEWKRYYQIANYLYVVPRQAFESSGLGGGFIGAADEYADHFEAFYLSESGTYNILRCFERIYPPQREWGYLVQFWLPPIRYFKCIFNVELCLTFEYATHCYELLSKEAGWKTFINLLQSGTLQRADLDVIQPIIESRTLSNSEKELAQHIIFDKDGIEREENLEYQKAYKLLLSLKEDGLQGFTPETQEDYGMVFSYAHLAGIQLGAFDSNWKMLVSSVIFDMGLSRLYTWLGKNAVSEVIDETRLNVDLNQLVHDWLSQNGFSGQLKDVIEQWKNKYLSTINKYQVAFKEMLDMEKLGTAIDGIIQGVILSQIPFNDKTQELEHYQRITDEYHRFAPQRYFNDHPVNMDQPFDKFFMAFVNDLILNQYTFGLERMGKGQKAKQILNYYEGHKQYVYQVDERRFHENRGIYDLIGATISTWKSAGLF